MLSYNRLMFGFYVYGKFIQELYAANEKQSPVADYNVINSSMRLGKENLNVYLKVLNMLDRDYEVLPGYSAPGRQMRIGLRYNY